MHMYKQCTFLFTYQVKIRAYLAMNIDVRAVYVTESRVGGREP